MPLKERFWGETVFMAECGMKYPIKQFYSEEGFIYHKKLINCRNCGNKAIFKTIFFNERGEVEGLFGSDYRCGACFHSSSAIAQNPDLYYNIIFGKI